MKLYFCHSRHFDYELELYAPLRESPLFAQHEILFPHDGKSEHSTKEIIKSCDMVFAEVSLPGTGLGIELGWADAFNRPIVCLHRTGAQVSNSLKFISHTSLEYADSQDLVRQVIAFLASKV